LKYLKFLFEIHVLVIYLKFLLEIIAFQALLQRCWRFCILCSEHINNKHDDDDDDKYENTVSVVVKCSDVITCAHKLTTGSHLYRSHGARKL